MQRFPKINPFQVENVRLRFFFASHGLFVCFLWFRSEPTLQNTRAGRMNIERWIEISSTRDGMRSDRLICIANRSNGGNRTRFVSVIVQQWHYVNNIYTQSNAHAPLRPFRSDFGLVVSVHHSVSDIDACPFEFCMSVASIGQLFLSVPLALMLYSIGAITAAIASKPAILYVHLFPFIHLSCLKIWSIIISATLISPPPPFISSHSSELFFIYSFSLFLSSLGSSLFSLASDFTYEISINSLCSRLALSCFDHRLYLKFSHNQQTLLCVYVYLCALLLLWKLLTVLLY